MFGISGEHLLIMGIVLLIFGPKRLPELGNTVGKFIRNFKDAVSGVEEAKFRHLQENPPPNPEQPAAPAGETVAQGQTTPPSQAIHPGSGHTAPTVEGVNAAAGETAPPTGNPGNSDGNPTT